MGGMKAIAFAAVLFMLAVPHASAYLWTVSGNSPVYPASPRPLPAVSDLDYGHCFGFHRDNCVYYSLPPLPPFQRFSYQHPLPPGLGLVGWRWENGIYVRDVYEGYGNARFCAGRYC